jgi:hypothetical protein
MEAKNVGDRHPLLFYQRTMGRMWRLTLFLGLILIGTWVITQIGTASPFLRAGGVLLLAAGIIVLMVSVFAFFARFMAYVQAQRKFLKIVTPFLRMKVSYRRMRSVRPMLVQQIFPKDKSRRSQRNFLEPFYGKTALILDLKGFPMNPTLLRLFIPAQMFSPQTTGFVLVVPDWMKLSTELESFRGSWLQAGKARERSESIRQW